MDDSLDNNKTKSNWNAEQPERSVGDLSTMRAERQRKRFKRGELILGRYKITGELGQGGMGVVFRCFDEVGGIDVALKALPPELAHNSVEMEEIRENFQLVQGLAHPNIAQIKTLEKDSDTGDVYLVMECVDGVNLRRWRKQGAAGKRSLDEILPILSQTVAALDYAHSQGIIHRDIKPSNIMIKPDGTVKLLDFGLAAQLHTSLSRVSQVQYGTSGTGPYMAPEQWRGRRQDQRTDLYALAAMTYELLAGHPPFQGHDPSVLRQAVLNETPQPIEGLDSATNRIIQSALDKEPENRYTDGAELLKDIDRLGLGQKKSGFKGFARAAIFLILLGGLGYGAFTFLKQHSPEPLPKEPAEVTQQEAPAPDKSDQSNQTDQAVPPREKTAKPADEAEVLFAIDPLEKKDGQSVYVVQTGDTLSQIASSYGVNVSTLREINGLAGGKILVHQELIIPADAQKKQAASAEGSANEADADIADAHDDRLGLNFKLIGGNRIFHEGEKIEFSLRPEQDCYLAVFCHQSDGTSVVLFPNRYSQSTRFEAGTKVEIPNTNDPRFQIVISPPFGTDVVEAVACSRKSDLHRLLENYAGEERDQYKSLTRGMVIKKIDNVIESAESANDDIGIRQCIEIETRK